MRLRKLLHGPRSALDILRFLARNLISARKVPEIPSGYKDGVKFSPCTKYLAPSIIAMYSEFHPGLQLGLRKSLLLRLVGTKLCLVVRDSKTHQPVGYSIYYFNARDCREKTVHEGDTGLLPDYRGRGIGTAQRHHALKHFAKVKSINGVSSRVSLNNLASLISNKNLGFEEQERYYDKAMNEERVYLICDLGPYREHS